MALGECLGKQHCVTKGFCIVARFLSLDWDQQQLHLVSAKVGKNALRVERAILLNEEKSPNPADAEELGKLLRERLKAAGIAPAPMFVCVSRDRVILKELRFPEVAPHEEPDMVRLQVLKELTDSPNDVVIDYISTPIPGTRERRAQALIVRKELLQTFQTICQTAGLKLAGVTPRPYGSAVTLTQLMGTNVLTPAPEPADAAVALVTVAERWAEFSVIRQGQVLLTRSLNVGPGLPGEIRRNLAVYGGQSPQQPVRSVFLALGSAPGEATAAADLRQRLGEMLDIPVHLFDPFAGDERPELPGGLRGSFVGAVGLLHAQARERELPVNFVQPRKPEAPQSKHGRLPVLVGGLLFALLIVSGAYAFTSIQRERREVGNLTEEDNRLSRELTEVQLAGKRLKALENWETVVWLDELYDLAQRIPRIDRDFQLTSIEGTSVKPTPRSPHVGKLTIKGITSSNKPLDQLTQEFQKDLGSKTGLFYRPEPPTLKRNEFQVEVFVKKRPPSEFLRELPAPKKEEKKEPPKKEEKKDNKEPPPEDDFPPFNE